MFKKSFVAPLQTTDPETAYDLWAKSYDSQPDNLMLALDEELFSNLIRTISFSGKAVVDIGCGTGRHWQKVIDKNPERLVGYDVSEGMLAMLKQKFPDAETNKLENNLLAGSRSESTDIIISTLTVAHIENIEEAFAEWNRILKPNGEIIISDYHPTALAKGGNRTFKNGDKSVAVKNNIYSIAQIEETTKRIGWSPLKIIQKRIDKSMQHYYEKQNALHLFHEFEGVPIIYGIHLKKSNVIA